MYHKPAPKGMWPELRDCFKFWGSRLIFVMGDDRHWKFGVLMDDSQS